MTRINCFNGEGSQDFLQTGQTSRVRSFPHVEGNYALHVYIPSKYHVLSSDFSCLFSMLCNGYSRDLLLDD